MKSQGPTHLTRSHMKDHTSGAAKESRQRCSHVLEHESSLRDSDGMKYRVAMLLIAGLSLQPICVQAMMLCGPYVQNPGTNHMTVMWESDVVREAVVTCHPLDDSNAVMAVAVTNYEGQMGETSYWYAAHLTGLQPGTRYAYTVTMEQAYDEGGIFRTFPATNETFSFVVIGDTHQNGRVLRSFASNMLACKPAFIMHTGDMVDNGKSPRPEAWRRGLFKPLGNVLRNVPILPARGNHDGGMDKIRLMFDLPGDEFNYSYTYGNTHFLCIDEYVDRANSALAWASNDLASCTSFWKIAYFHRPIFNIADHGWVSKRDTYLPLFEKYRLDMTRCGHAHVYERFLPIVWGDPEVTNPIVHIVSGGGGGDLNRRGGTRKDPKLLANTGYNHYSVITIDGSTLHGQVFGMKGEKYDDYILTKNSDGSYAHDIVDSSLRNPKVP